MICLVGGAAMIRIGKIVSTLVVLFLTNFLVLSIWTASGWLTCMAGYLILFFCFLVVNIVPLWGKGNFTRLGAMFGGEILMEIFAASFTFNLILTIFYGVHLLFDTLSLLQFIIHILLWLLFNGIVVLNAGIRMCTTSVQLGIKWRVLLLFFCWVPVINLFLLWKICRIVKEEYLVEIEKQELNNVRKLNEDCKTKYPIVMVHGVFFRDRKYFNYWGRVPAELIRNGATIYYGNQQSAASTQEAAKELKEKILQIVEETKCEKVNIIAHSKGGLESRCAISCLGLAPYVASLTTINTPHRGCAFVDWLLKKMPKCVCDRIANGYNKTLRRFGDPNPDFYAAVCDLTSEQCAKFNQATPDMSGVFYQSVGSKMKGWSSAPFPQNFSYLLVKWFDKENDGLVGVNSMKWGNSFQMLCASGHRGISHGDMIDLNRQNIKGFDVREFYVELVKSLKGRGY